MDSTTTTTTLVVKVSYGGVLRRFRLPIKPNGTLDLDMAGLRGKIASLFNFSIDSEFTMTYSDEDGDLVALVDDNDLYDVTNQRLKFLKINVQSNTGLLPTNSTVTPVESKGSSTVVVTPNRQNPVTNIEKSFHDFLKALPKPVHDIESMVCKEVASKAASSIHVLDRISKLGKVSKPQKSSPSLSRKVPSQTGIKPASFNECPFSGSNFSSKDSTIFNKKSSTPLVVFHKGIICDGCEAVPITGPRFKSKVKEDYDLCNICFSVMGNDKDYIRMDKPIPVQYKHPSRGLYMGFGLPQGGFNLNSTRLKLDSRFVLDVNVTDGTVVAPSTPFTKIWKMRNNGSLVWPYGTHIVCVGGDKFSNSFSVDLKIPEEGMPVNSELDVEVDFIAPESPGRYISYWRMASSDGVKFGQRIWVLIHVETVKFGLDRDINEVVYPTIPCTLTPSSSSSSYNLIEFANVPSSTKEIQVPVKEDITNNKEVALTDRDMDVAMGIKKEEILRMIDIRRREYEYNLEQFADEVCVNEWGPILEELHEMGFCDDVTNKRLLEKINGSIKGVVMNLLNGDEEA